MKNFFLEGDKFVGKSTLIQQVIKDMKIPVDGFYVNRMINEQQEIVGFELRSASELSLVQNEISERKEHCFIVNKNGEKRRDLTVFDGFGRKLLSKASISENIILLDEIGGVELLSDSFAEDLYQIFKLPKKIIGVFKSEKNYQNQKLHTSKKLEITQKREHLKKVILESDGEIMTLTQKNRQLIQEKLRYFLTH